MKDIRPRNPLLWIKYLYLEWSWDRVLRQYDSWTHYQFMNDPDWNPSGINIREQLFGYPYIAEIPEKYIELQFDPFWGPFEQFTKITNWCDKYCNHKYGPAWKRVIKNHEDQYVRNGAGSSDQLYFGFKDERDYIMFVMRWS